MKKNRLIRLLPLGAFTAITLLVLTAVNYPYRAKLIKHRFQNTQAANHTDFAPITGSEQLFLSNENKMAYWIQDASGTFANPLMVNPMVNVQDIYTYYNSNNQGKYTGIRFYPAYENYHLFLIMCLATSGNSDEYKYIKLDKELFNVQGSVLAPANEITANETRNLLHRYLNEVFLYKNQQDTTTTDDSLKYARYYAWDDFKALAVQNIKGGNKVDFLFQMDIGYVTQQMASILYTRTKDPFTEKQIQGFTAMIHVKDKNGNSLLDPFSRYDNSDPNEKDNYLGRSMEVGSPCPPRCGIR